MKTAKIGCPAPPEETRNHEWEMHPEDKKMQAEGREYGEKHAAEFCAEHKRELQALIALYPDARSEALLASLREQFWSQQWKPKAK